MQFEEDGYLVIEDFLDEASIQELKHDCSSLVDDMDPTQHNTVFSTVKQVCKNYTVYIII